MKSFTYRDAQAALIAHQSQSLPLTGEAGDMMSQHYVIQHGTRILAIAELVEDPPQSVIASPRVYLGEHSYGLRYRQGVSA